MQTIIIINNIIVIVITIIRGMHIREAGNEAACIDIVSPTLTPHVNRAGACCKR